MGETLFAVRGGGWDVGMFPSRSTVDESILRMSLVQFRNPDAGGQGDS
jgi:hypothetical protein